MIKFILALILSVPLSLVLADGSPHRSSHELVARSKSYAQLSDGYVMKDSTIPEDNWLTIYYPNGKPAYKFHRATFDIRHGISTTTISDPSERFQQSLASSDDVCFTSSHYTNGNFTIKINPRGPQADSWHLTVDSTWGKQKYHLERNYLNKDGRIFNKDKVVAALTSQKSFDPWLNTNGKGVNTYTLHIARDFPHPPFIALMGLVLVRTDVCGL
ncbi:hypothetical protein O181_041853 [Austropuccinia psidii MF-1]|uniref:Uncharacterized protein n=1 Tax=Austropuccinia psidii MF-1 TaxID=1389203 RepID=A0A9Q3DK00_9BASI|nr:hypothetical protein [Austropuccinia psidii MF-1]